MSNTDVLDLIKEVSALNAIVKQLQTDKSEIVKQLQTDKEKLSDALHALKNKIHAEQDSLRDEQRELQKDYARLDARMQKIEGLMSHISDTTDKLSDVIDKHSQSFSDIKSLQKSLQWTVIIISSIGFVLLQIFQDLSIIDLFKSVL